MKTPSLPTLLCLILTGQVFAAKVIPNNPIADLVLGQQDFVTKTYAVPYTSFKMGNPLSVLVDPVSRKVFVGELQGDRILRYPSVAALVNGAPVEEVFGQINFGVEGESGGTTGPTDPGGMFLDHFGRLWVADTYNHRVLVYDAAA